MVTRSFLNLWGHTKLASKKLYPDQLESENYERMPGVQQLTCRMYCSSDGIQFNSEQNAQAGQYYSAQLFPKFPSKKTEKDVSLDPHQEGSCATIKGGYG